MRLVKSFPLLFAAFSVSVFSAAGQKMPPDPDYIREYPGTFTARAFVGEKISGFSLLDGARGERLDYRPNNVLGVGLGVTVRGLGINVSVRLPAHEEKDDLY